VLKREHGDFAVTEETRLVAVREPRADLAQVSGHDSLNEGPQQVGD
jgi:hypothetical protein